MDRNQQLSVVWPSKCGLLAAALLLLLNFHGPHARDCSPEETQRRRFHHRHNLFLGNETLNSTHHQILCRERVRMINVINWSCCIPAGSATHIVFSTVPKMSCNLSKTAYSERAPTFPTEKGSFESLTRSRRPCTLLRVTFSLSFFQQPR